MEMLRAKYAIAIWSVLGIGWTNTSVSSLHAAPQKEADKGQEKKELVETDKTLMNESPFDLIYVKKEAGGEVVRVLPIDFPNRTVPASPDPTGKFIVSLVQHPDRKYEVRWKDIDTLPDGRPKIILFEEQVLADAKDLMQKKEYAAAFEHLNYLIAFYPQTPGLERLKEDFLFTSASEMFAQQRLHHTLAVLEELQRSYPNSRVNQVRNGISNVADQIMQAYVKSGDLRAAQILLDRLKKDYSEAPIESVLRWEAEFKRQADEFTTQAKKFMAEGKLREARDAAARGLAIMAKSEDAQDLLDEINRLYPSMRIGVFQKSSHPDPTSLTDWGSRRSGQLTSRPLFQFKSTGTEGGVYDFAFGKFAQSDDRKELDIQFKKNAAPIAPDVAEWLIDRAQPASQRYSASWASILREVHMDSADRLVVRFRNPHVLPHALLQWQLETIPSLAATAAAGAYRMGDATENESFFLWNQSAKPEEGRPVEIMERFYEDHQKALADLKRGEIDVIDQLFPSDVKLLKGVAGIKVEQYSLPSIHMIVFRGDHRYLKEGTFRRALLYGINREAVLNDELMGGVEDPNCRLISGPFPMGSSDNDPLSYAYNRNVPVLPYDRMLSKLLFILAQKDIASHAAKKKIPVPEFEKLRFGVPDVEFARAAAEAFIQQWAIIGIPVEMVVLPKGMTTPPEGEKVDMLFVSSAIWEPVTDAERIFGADGIAASNDPFIVQALGALQSSRNWTDVRRSFQNLHLLIAEHLPVLPLWQVSDSFAYRTTIRGISPRPLTLYQGLDKWRMTETKR